MSLDAPRSARQGAPPDPALAWRGLSLDVARHFFAVADVEFVLDLMEPLRLNVLHLHLTDDQGWRLEIPGWPRLTSVSGPTAVDGDAGGFYTRSDWERLAGRATARGIALVPEIDVPGHVNAALHALPRLSPDGRAPAAYTGRDVGFSTLSIDAPDTGRFLEEVLTHAARLSSGWVHIGGDEPAATPHDAYLQLARAAVRAVHRAGARAVAWQEAAPVLEAGDVVQVWDERLDAAPVREAARRGVRVLLSPATRVYLDMAHSPGDALGASWAGSIELRDALEWDPAAVVPGLPAAAVIGVEAAMWTEGVRTRDELTTLLLPRLAAVADVAARGSGAGRWEEFLPRVIRLAREWESRGLAWHRSPGVDWAS
jgi:hexosaminidase